MLTKSPVASICVLARELLVLNYIHTIVIFSGWAMYCGVTLWGGMFELKERIQKEENKRSNASEALGVRSSVAAAWEIIKVRVSLRLGYLRWQKTNNNLTRYVCVLRGVCDDGEWCGYTILICTAPHASVASQRYVALIVFQA